MAKAWSKWIEEAGLKARLFRWGRRPQLYYDFTDPLTGVRVRRSTRRATKKEAEDKVRAILEVLAREGEGRTMFGDDTDLGTVFRLFFELKVPHYAAAWQKSSHARRDLFERAWGQRKPASDIGQSDVDRYRDLRTSGELAPEKANVKAVRDGTVEAELRWLSTVFRWAHGHKVAGKRLVPSNPLDGLKRPQAVNVRRPIASHVRFLKTIEKAEKVDPKGRLRCMLTLARYTGRRENAICSLMASDFLRTPSVVAGALAAMGQDESRAEHFPHGGLHWRAETDKMGVEQITPLSAPARAAIDAYLDRDPRLGEVPLFPSPRDPAKPVRRDLADKWLVRAERLAELPKLSGGRWHPYRRLFATELKSVPVQDVAAAGGWKSVETVQRIYQQAEAKGVLDAIQQVAKGA